MAILHICAPGPCLGIGLDFCHQEVCVTTSLDACLCLRKNTDTSAEIPVISGQAQQAAVQLSQAPEEPCNKVAKTFADCMCALSLGQLDENAAVLTVDAVPKWRLPNLH